MSSSNSLLKKIFILNLIGINFSSFLFSVDPTEIAASLQNKKDKYGHSVFSGFRNPAAELNAEREYRKDLKRDKEELMKESVAYQKSLAELEQQRNKADVDQVELESKIQKTIEEIKDKQQELDWVEAYLIDDSWGKIFFSAFVGSNSKLIDKSHFKTPLEGLYKGIAYSGLVPVQKALGRTMETYVNRFFDGTFGKVEEFVSFIYRLIFHKGLTPFVSQEIIAWKKLIGSDLRQIELMIKNAEKFDSRGRSEILREYEEEESEKHVINLWQDFIEDLAITYEELAEEIEIRKNYYRKNNNGYGIVNCANRLQNKLLKTKDIFLSVKSLKDLANLPESKSIVPTMQKSFDNYFDNLGDLIKPLSDKKSPVTGSGSNYSSDNRYNDSSSYSGSAYPYSRSADY